MMMARNTPPNQNDGCGSAIVMLLLYLFGPFLLEVIALIVLIIIISIATGR
jgi:hypothetical protein